ncbi:MAG: helix-turn-helix domain-containing protein [Candidatus Binatus sp.]|jgi:AcrR family transcriptional regulator|uniref:TetR/AcrR family transcriptional regulator n=1 Tax=Candidatus Binatus sp. TaxID=2811406 RepID=UPI003D1330AD
MSTAEKRISADKVERISPRERILSAASELFYRHGIRAVGVDAVAEAAETNKMTLYRHFSSKDELVAEYLQRLAEKAKASWDRLEADHPGEPSAQLRAWLKNMAAHVANGDERGCALANAAVELPEKDHPARRVIEAFKTAQRERLVQLCAAASLAEPEMLADELFLLLEGARVTAQSMGRKGLDDRLVRMGEATIQAHTIF